MCGLPYLCNLTKQEDITVMNKEKTKSRLEKSDYSVLWTIILYGIFVYFVIEEYLIGMSSEFMKSDLLALFVYLCPILFFGIAQFSIYKKRSTPEDWGLSLGKPFRWHSFLFLFLFAMWYTPELSVNLFIKTIPITLVLTASMLLLQARLQTLLKKILGSSKFSLTLIALVTGLIYILTLFPVFPFKFIPIVLILIIAAMILESKSILLAIPVVGMIIIANNDTYEGVHFAICILSFIIYFAMAFGARLIFKLKET